jgi:hypothetical protein
VTLHAESTKIISTGGLANPAAQPAKSLKIFDHWQNCLGQACRAVFEQRGVRPAHDGRNRDRTAIRDRSFNP